MSYNAEMKIIPSFDHWINQALIKVASLLFKSLVLNYTRKIRLYLSKANEEFAVKDAEGCIKSSIPLLL